MREGVQRYEAMVVPSTLWQLVLTMTHDLLGHNGSTRLYNYIRWFYFWQELKQESANHVCKCKDCQQVTLKNQHYIDSNLRISNVLMACIAMILLGEYSEMTQGHHYALTVICMLTSFVEVIPIRDKKTEMVTKAYIKYVYANKDGSKFILRDRGGEFSSEVMSYIAEQLGFTKVYTSPYSPKLNSIIKRCHSFLKN